MKLKNKKTGEIVEKWPDNFVVNSGSQIYNYHSLAKLCEEWEDVPEGPKEYWWIRYDGTIAHAEIGTMRFTKQKEIGNCFYSREEAEKAVEKLKAYKRLKDKGFKFKFYYHHPFPGDNLLVYSLSDVDECVEDLDLLFGGEG